MAISIREAASNDASMMLEMLRNSAQDQGFPDDVVVSEEDLRRDGFGDDPLFKALIAEVDGAPAGMALYFFNYSTWVSRVGLYLEDLYVNPQFRGAGVARELMEHLARIAKSNGCRRFQWLVHTGNERALRFYESCGAKPHRDWLLMSLQGNVLDEFVR